MTDTYRTKIASNTFTELLPYHPYTKTEPGWRDGMVTGNGENGVVCSCSPYSDTMTFQNMYFIMPSRQPRFVPPEVGGELHEARQAVIHFDDTWNIHNRHRTFLYCFHPGHQLRLQMEKQELLSYQRETDYETAEIIVTYTDKNGTWTRKTFTSREDNVTITQLSSSDTGNRINVDISLDDLASMKNFGKGLFPGGGKRDEENMQYKKHMEDKGSYLYLAAHYPSYEGSELARGGFAGVTRIITVGGSKQVIKGEDFHEEVNVGKEKNPVLRIESAEEIYFITKTARTHHMGSYEDFAAADHYEIVDQLLADTREAAAKYTEEDGRFSYEKALAPHKKKQSVLFHSVSFCLGSDKDKELYNEELLEKQKNSKSLSDAFVERVYNQGRYAQICCSGFSAPRLCGLWTGEWNPGWNGAYTMDANVNLQVSGMNTGNVYDAALGYIYFILRQLKDWEENAAMVYGMKDAMLIPVNTDGDRAIMVEYDQYYPFEYWNAGASWMLLPVYEFWQCFGNCKIPVKDMIKNLYSQEWLDLERDILYPLLKKQANFWAQLCTPEYFTDINGNACYEEGKRELATGEKYLILPSYSPENRPNGYNSTITANAAMDISAARDGLKMMIEIEKALASKGHEEEVAKWSRLIEQLPEYKYDETGALCEWAMKEYKENHAHRHISHLYCAWPAYEAQNNEALRKACTTAIANRNRENKGKDDTASHGWVHKALVAARLKNADSAYELLYTIMASNIYFTSLMTDHNTDRGTGVYCTDTSLGTVGIIDEMLVYSNTGEIELLPALPKQWAIGSINGLMTRTNAQITRLSWDLEKGKLTVSIRSRKDQLILLGCRIGKGKLTASNGAVYSNYSKIAWKNNEEITISMDIA